METASSNFNLSNSDIDFEFGSSECDDVSIASNASSASVSIGSDFSDSDEGVKPNGGNGTRIHTSAGGFQRRAPARTKSGKGMASASASTVTEEESGTTFPLSARSRSGNFSRRPPVRTKSREGVLIPGPPLAMADGGYRSPPQRTKSGAGYAQFQSSRPTLRTNKSGDGLVLNVYTTSTDDDGNDDDYDGDDGNNDYEMPLPSSYDDDDDRVVGLPRSPGKFRSEGPRDTEYREKALERNSARRQKSSDMLGAMRQATKNMPQRCRSNTGLLNGRRRAPGRSKSESPEGLGGNHGLGGSAPTHRRPERRKAPPRTKSGDGLGGDTTTTSASTSPRGLSPSLEVPEVSPPKAS